MTNCKLKTIISLMFLISTLIISNIAFAAKDINSLSFTLTDSKGKTVNTSSSSYYYDTRAKEPTVTVKDGGNVVTTGFTVSYNNNVYASNQYLENGMYLTDNSGSPIHDRYAQVIIKGDGVTYSGTHTENFLIKNTPINKITIEVAVKGHEEGVEKEGKVYAGKVYDGKVSYPVVKEAYITGDDGTKVHLDYWEGKSFNGKDTYIDPYTGEKVTMSECAMLQVAEDVKNIDTNYFCEFWNSSFAWEGDVIVKYLLVVKASTPEPDPTPGENVLKVFWSDKDTFYYDGQYHIRFGKVTTDVKGHKVTYTLEEPQVVVGNYTATINNIVVKDSSGKDVTSTYKKLSKSELERDFRIIKSAITPQDPKDPTKPGTDPNQPTVDPIKPGDPVPEKEPEQDKHVKIIVELPDEEYTYDGDPKKPKPVVKLIIVDDKTGKPIGTPKILEEGKDYKVEYENNIDAGDPKSPNPPTVKVVALPNANIEGENVRPFTIKPAPLTVKADDKNIKKGDNIPELTYKVTGAVKDEVPKFDGTPETTAKKNSDVGSYPIKVDKDIMPAKENGKFNPKNYDIKYVNGTLKISTTGGGGPSGGGNPGTEPNEERIAAVELRNGSKSKNKANDNIYRLDEEVIYYCDYMNKTDVDIPKAKMVLHLPLTFKVVSTDGGTYDSKTNTITWDLGRLKSYATGSKEVTIKYTAFKKAVKNESTSYIESNYAKVYPYLVLYEVKSSKNIFLDDSSVINEIIEDLDMAIDTKHIRYMWGDQEKPTFRPLDGISRAEGAMVLMRIFEEDYSKVNVKGDEYTDIMDTYDEARRAIIKASELDVIDGYTDGTYKPNKKMTRAEFMKIIASYIEVMGKRNGIKGLNAENAKNVSIYSAQKGWSNPYITLLARLNMVPLSDNNSDLDVNGYIKRAEVAQLCNYYLFRAPVFDNGKIKLPFDDVNSNTYLFGDIVEATRASHDSAWLNERAYEIYD